MSIITLDFETLPITTPNNPPKPVGVALKEGNGESIYLAWGHPSENNCTRNDAIDTLKAVWEDVLRGYELLMHNAKFDLAVAKEWFGLPVPPVDKIHDTMIEAFLCSPYESTLGLKPLADRWLKWPAEERDAVVDWLGSNLLLEGKKLSKSKKSERYAGKYIGYAPGNLVGRYAIGDVERTYALHTQFIQYLTKTGMECAYMRERKLLPILMANEQSGMRIDVEKAVDTIERADDACEKVDAWIGKTLGVPGLSVTSTDELASALKTKGLVDTDKLLKTAKGKDSYAKGSIEAALPPIWSQLITYRRQLATTCGTFIVPWLEQAIPNNGIIYTSWNQVAQEKSGTGAGTRTGRFSCNPSFSNIPKIGGDDIPLELSQFVGFELPPVPYVRGLIIPWDKDWVLIDRDYSQQELRIGAHMGEGPVLQAYRKYPWTDLHEYVQDMLKSQYGINLVRKKVKGVNFAISYGGGIKRVSEVLGCDKAVAKTIRSAILGIHAGLAGLYSECERRAQQDLPIRTWGGRLYYCQPSEYDTAYRKSNSYKLVNYLIQGSAGDNLKEAWINLGFDADWFKTYITVHDQFLATCPKSMIHEGHERLRRAMQDVDFDVPMLSEGKWSSKDWAHMEEYDVKGTCIYKE